MNALIIEPIQTYYYLLKMISKTQVVKMLALASFPCQSCFTLQSKQMWAEEYTGNQGEHGNETRDSILTTTAVLIFDPLNIEH